MSISFGDIYTKAIALFDDPKIVIAYKTNRVQFSKLMYTYLQNAIACFTNPTSIGIKLSDFSVPQGKMEIFEGDGENKKFSISPEIVLVDNAVYLFLQNGKNVEAVLNKEDYTIEFPEVLPVGQQYVFEQYYLGEFNNDFGESFNSKVPKGNSLVVEEIKNILARLLVKAWAEEERNLLLDIRNIMQDSDFKITGNDKILHSKNEWVDQLDTEILQLQNKLAWNIRFMNSSQNIGRG